MNPTQVWGWIVIGGVLSLHVILDNQTIYLIKQENNIQWDSTGKYIADIFRNEAAAATLDLVSVQSQDSVSAV